jgi:hypothetical protein
MNKLGALPPLFDLLLLSILSLSYILFEPLEDCSLNELRFLVIALVGAGWIYAWLGTPVSSTGISPGSTTLLGIVVTLLVILPTVLAIAVRSQSEPHHCVHDGLIQSEEAARFTWHAQNPYTADYTSTSMSDWDFQVGDLTENPALYHYPYMPLTFLLPLPVHWLGEQVLDWFDHRVIYLLLYAGLIAIGGRLAAPPYDRQMLRIVLALNPLLTVYLVEGRNDILVLFWIVVTLALLQQGRNCWSAVTFALACATKQLAWFFVPFYMLYVAGQGSPAERVRRVRKPLLVLAGGLAVSVLPWLLWGPRAFIEDTLMFQSGTLADSYPINGYGISMLMLAWGIVDSHTASFPFGVLQVLVGIPLLIVFLRRQWHSNDLQTALVHFWLLLAAVSFLGRAFNENYLGFLLSLMAISVWITRLRPQPGTCDKGGGLSSASIKGSTPDLL